MRRTIIAIAATIATLSGAHAAVQTVEADNGAVYRIDAIHVPYNHAYPINVEVSDDDRQVIILAFDCEGHFLPGLNGHWRSIPPQCGGEDCSDCVR